MLDCMWIQQLHTIGLLRGNFLPDEYTRQLRTYYHHRQSLVEQSAKYALKMQQSLRLMNIRLDVAIRDITGKTGMSIINAILQGERDANKLASLADIRVKKSTSEIAASLQGEWKKDLLFTLQDCHEMYRFYRKKIKVVDIQMEKLLNDGLTNKKSILPLEKVKKKKTHKNDLRFDLRSIAYQIFGVDLYQINGISNGTVLCLLSTIGEGIYKFPSSKHFVSWMRLAPNNKISGGKLLSSRTPKGRNKLSLALRQAANAIGNTKEHPLKRFFNRVAYRKGRGAAITATARKLAAIIYHLLIKKEEFNPDYLGHHQKYEQQKKIISIKKMLAKVSLSEQEKNYIFT